MDDVANLVVTGVSFVGGVYLCRKLLSPGPLIGQGSYREPSWVPYQEHRSICLHMVYAFKTCSERKHEFNCDNMHDRLRHFCGTEFDPPLPF